MNNIISWTAEDEAIIATNTDATECKRCAVELGYWKDDYIVYFAKHVDRKAPKINRGYYARVKAMEMFIHQFLEVVIFNATYLKLKSIENIHLLFFLLTALRNQMPNHKFRMWI